MTTIDPEQVAANLVRVRTAIEAAIARRGPGPDVHLIAVSKRQPPEAIRAALRAGQLHFGENYAQELRDKVEVLGPESGIVWHYIGPLQSNKVKYVVGRSRVHTVDRTTILEAIERRAATAGCVQDVLVQVNLLREPQKSGVDPDDLAPLLDRFADCDHVRCRGLMLIPPAGPPAAARGHFRDLRRLRDRVAAHARVHVDLAELSMGMSSDYAIAVEEGATWIRVGTAIFGARPP